MGRSVRAAALAAAAWLAAPRASADGVCVSGATPDPSEATGTFLFPNWTRAHLSTYTIWLCDTGVCTFGTTERFAGLTIVNFGTATDADLATLYWRAGCGAPDTGFVAMTYAGLWGGQPVWTWAGLSLDLASCGADPDYSVPLRIYADVDPCPGNGRTVTLGIRADLTNPALPGGLTDEWAGQGCAAPWDTIADARTKLITYVAKAKDRDTAAPGDTVTYTVWYGRPGAADPSPLTIFETLPAYTHWNGVASKAPDAGWDPDPGPPVRLKWTIPGPLPPAGGPTGQLTFQATVDWGNGESFEPGSGDVAAPEGARLENTVQASYAAGGCGALNHVSNAPSFTVRRYLLWMLGDNDVLFAGKTGVPDDEIIYATTIRNMSSQKTWHNVTVWDTVPAELDVWSPGFGHDDPCLGWTISPSGCAAFNAGRAAAGAATILTWTLDLPPGLSLALRWKARVSQVNAPAGSTAANIVSMRAFGRPGTLGGTGDAGAPRTFTHLARIVLRTTYVSYMAWGGAENAQAGFMITFYPLNKAANFELRALEYQDPATYPVTGGVSASIGAYLGNCLGGFGVCGMVTAGCGVERRPATYLDWRSPNCLLCDSATVNRPAEPAHFLYKVVANAPVLWSLYTAIRNTPQDQQAFTPSTSLSFSGFMHYTFRREVVSLAGPTDGDALNIVNTSINAAGTLDASLPTSVILFTWDPASWSWQFYAMADVAAESQWALPPTPAYAPCGHYRIVSSDARLLVRQSNAFWGMCTGNANSGSSLSPTRETGTLVSKGAGDTFYLFPTSLTSSNENGVVVGNLGAAPVTYRIEKYLPRDITAPAACIPPWMADTAGTWGFVQRDVVPATTMPAKTPGNPHVYGSAYDTSYVFPTASQDGGVWRIVQETPGHLSVGSGGRVTSAWAGGSMLHDNEGGVVGDEFWVFTAWNWNAACSAPFGAIAWLDAFCPKSGMAVEAVTDDGYASSYTTNGADQCVTFVALTDVALGATRAIRLRLLPTGTQGNLVAMHNECVGNHKFFTAPFLVEGTHYDIIAPPVAFLGQSFWITVLVVQTAGGTETGYCGVTSFTSTDPAARLESQPLDSYNYTWTSAANCPPGSGTADDGVRLFFNVTFGRLGYQTIVATDLLDGSITGLTTVLVVAADVKLTKEPALQLAASGDTVQFRVCWSNYSSASASTFTVTDAVPAGTVYVPDAPSNHLCGATKGFGAATVAYSTTGNAPGNFSTMTGPASTAVTWLRWTIPTAGVATTGCVCFRVRVN